MMFRLFATVLVLGGCVEVPRASESTIQRVQRTRVLRAGVVTGVDQIPHRTQVAFLQRLANETGSVPQIVTGPSDALFGKVEGGTLDVVVAPDAPDTSWNDRVRVLPTRHGEATGGGRNPVAAVRNGEKAWVSVVYRHAPVLLGIDD